MLSISLDSSCPIDLLGPEDGVQEFSMKQVVVLLFAGKSLAPFDISGFGFSFLFTGDAGMQSAVLQAADFSTDPLFSGDQGLGRAGPWGCL